MSSNFTFKSVTKTYKASSVKPSVLAKIFKLDETSIILTDEEDEPHIVDGDKFDPPLVEGKNYTIDAVTLIELEETADEENTAVMLKELNNEITGIQGDARNALITEIIQNCQNLDESANMLYHGPQAVIVVQGIAILAAASPDPSLICDEMPVENFKHLTTPSSFRASLYQVASAMCNAFRQADSSMNTIRAALADLPDYFYAALEIIGQPDGQKCTKTLNIVIKKLEKTSETCIEQAYKAYNSFNGVIDVIDELSQTSIQSNAVNTRQVEKLKGLKREFEIRKQAQEGELRRNEEAFKEAKEQAKQALEEYRKQVSDKKLVGKLFVAALTDGIMDAIKNLTSNCNILPGKLRNNLPARNLTNVSTGIVQTSVPMKVGMESALFNCLQKITSTLDNIEKLEDGTIEDYILSLKDFAKHSGATKESQELFKKAEEFRQFLETNKKSLKEPNMKDKVKEQQLSIKNALNTYNAARQEQQQQQQQQQQRQRNTGQNSTQANSLCEQIAKAHTDKTRSMQVHYNSQAAREDELRRQLSQNRAEITNIICQLESIDTRTVKLEDIINHLHEAINYLTKVKENWLYLTQFFDNIKIVVEQNLKPSIEMFTDFAKDDLSKRMLLIAALKSIGYGVQISNGAQIYLEISKTYVMPVIGNIGKEFALTREEARIKQVEIRQKMDQVDDSIEKLIQNKQEEFKQRVNEQMGKYAENLIKSIKLAATTKKPIT